MVRIDIFIRVIQFCVLVEHRLGAHKELSILGVCATENGRCTVPFCCDVDFRITVASQHITQ